jgi:hypothetical protein
MTSTARNRPASGYNDQIGFGTVDAAAALTAAARLNAKGLAGPGALADVTKTSLSAAGLSAASHFGGGPASVGPVPVAGRGIGRLVAFCVLAAGCLALIIIATSRLILMRRPRAAPGAPSGFTPQMSATQPLDYWTPQERDDWGSPGTSWPRD